MHSFLTLDENSMRKDCQQPVVNEHNRFVLVPSQKTNAVTNNGPHLRKMASQNERSCRHEAHGSSPEAVVGHHKILKQENLRCLPKYVKLTEVSASNKQNCGFLSQTTTVSLQARSVVSGYDTQCCKLNAISSISSLFDENRSETSVDQPTGDSQPDENQKHSITLPPFPPKPTKISQQHANGPLLTRQQQVLEVDPSEIAAHHQSKSALLTESETSFSNNQDPFMSAPLEKPVYHQPQPETVPPKAQLGHADLSKINPQSIIFEELAFVRELGCGQFGRVYLVLHDKVQYALKCISKSDIINQKLERQLQVALVLLQQEKRVMERLQFPFIVRFVRSFKTPEHVFFLQEYIEGREMFDIIRSIGLLSSDLCRFYIASLVLCLEYLASQNVIYRDLKPENIMVDSDGFIKLIDLGTCKVMKESAARTYTIIGTPHYMAPEILQSNGYDSLVDLWSVGVCFYEFMCGSLPFGEQVEDPYEIYDQINSSGLAFPNFFDDQLARNLIKQLLSRQPSNRLGGSFQNLKANAWFVKIDWVEAVFIQKGLVNKEIIPPYKLPIKEDTASNQPIPSPQGFLTEKPKLTKRSSGKNFDANWDAIF